MQPEVTVFPVVPPGRRRKGGLIELSGKTNKAAGGCPPAALSWSEATSGYFFLRFFVARFLVARFFVALFFVARFFAAFFLVARFLVARFFVARFLVARFLVALLRVAFLAARLRGAAFLAARFFLATVRPPSTRNWRVRPRFCRHFADMPQLANETNTTSERFGAAPCLRQPSIQAMEQQRGNRFSKLCCTHHRKNTTRF